MKVCSTCSTRPMKKRIYLAKIENFFDEKLPKSTKKYNQSSKSTYHIKLEGLKPNTHIFYFASEPRDFRKPILSMQKAYNNLKNSGVTKSDKSGKVTFYLKCPQIYRNDDGKIYSRHFHFLYWDKKNKNWNKRIYTHQIFCDIHQNNVKDYMKSNKVTVINALPTKYYCEKHIKGSINIPSKKSYTEKSIMKIIKKHNKHFKKLDPIIVYCYSSKCSAAKKLLNKLNKLGFYNTLHYIDGIKKWDGSISKCDDKSHKH